MFARWLAANQQAANSFANEIAEMHDFTPAKAEAGDIAKAVDMKGTTSHE